MRSGWEHPTHIAYTPPADLMPWVEELWYSAGTLERSKEHVLPSATADIVINLGAPIALLQDTDPTQLTGSSVSGLLTRPMVLQHPNWHTTIGIRLSALGLRALFGVPGRLIRDQCIQIDTLTERTDTLANICADAPNPKTALDRTIAWLRRSAQQFSHTIDPLVTWATSTIADADGNVSVHTLQHASGYGATRFNARFVEELGLTPKRYARLVRFRRALDQLGDNTPLVQLALNLGLTDQAHLNREFRLLGHTTPHEVLASRYISGLTIALK